MSWVGARADLHGGSHADVLCSAKLQLLMPAVLGLAELSADAALLHPVNLLDVVSLLVLSLLLAPAASTLRSWRRLWSASATCSLFRQAWQTAARGCACKGDVRAWRGCRRCQDMV